MKNYTTCLFDLDGTLVESKKLKGKALAETCNLFGDKVDATIYKSVMGESWFQVTRYFFKVAEIEPNIDLFNAEFKNIYQQLLSIELLPNPNVEELLTQLKAMGKNLGVVSSADKWMVNQVLSEMNFIDYFDVVITKELVEKHKPNPEAYLLALKKLSVSSSEVLVFEDSRAGLLAAKNANCDSVAFRHEYNVNNDFGLALQVISDFNQFVLVD